MICDQQSSHAIYIISQTKKDNDTHQSLSSHKVSDSTWRRREKDCRL